MVLNQHRVLAPPPFPHFQLYLHLLSRIPAIGGYRILGQLEKEIKFSDILNSDVSHKEATLSAAAVHKIDVVIRNLDLKTKFSRPF